MHNHLTFIPECLTILNRTCKKTLIINQAQKGRKERMMFSLMFMPDGTKTSLQDGDFISIQREAWGGLPRVKVLRGEGRRLIRLEIGVLRKLEMPILQHEGDLKWDPQYIADLLGIKSKKLDLISPPDENIDLDYFYRVVSS